MRLLVRLSFLIYCCLLVVLVVLPKTTYGRLRSGKLLNNEEAEPVSQEQQQQQQQEQQKEAGDNETQEGGIEYHDDGEYDRDIEGDEEESLFELERRYQEQGDEMFKNLNVSFIQDVDDENEPVRQLSEEQRVDEYNKRGYTWPIPDNAIIPNTTGYIQSIRKKIEQIDYITNTTDRWVAFETLQTMLLIPNFTQHGFGITKCIDTELMDELRATVRTGYEQQLARDEGEDIIMPGPLPTLLLSGHDMLTTRVYVELQRYAEAWVGIPLKPFGAYGFRIYQNGTQLMMHLDRPKTHIISFILHIDHSDDGTPWPLVIEDYHGNTHEVTLESGDMLFYESAKLLHGRPRPFNGTWYCSVFVHYYPADGWEGKNIDTEALIAVPPKWDQPISNKLIPNLPKLQLYETGITEPECQYGWCGLQNSIKLSGPGPSQYYIASDGKQFPLNIEPTYIPPLLSSLVRGETDEELEEL